MRSALIGATWIHATRPRTSELQPHYGLTIEMFDDLESCLHVHGERTEIVLEDPARWRHLSDDGIRLDALHAPLAEVLDGRAEQRRRDALISLIRCDDEAHDRADIGPRFTGHVEQLGLRCRVTPADDAA